PRCRLWVDRSGRVLKQESLILGSKLVFARRTDAAAENLIAGVGPIPGAAPAGESADSEPGHEEHVEKRNP
ncbi:MAG: hypothetical protein ACKO6B_08650, partial [Planctomycetia bacterium]